MLNSFETEAKAGFAAFWGSSGAAKGSGDAATGVDVFVDTAGIEAGVEASKWVTDKSPTILIREYAIEDEEYNEETSAVTF